MPFRPFLCLLLALLASLVVASAQAGQVTVFAAASLKDALEEIAIGFEAQTGNKVSLSLAGSSALARQIQLGAPADVYISANSVWMDFLAREGLIDPLSRFDLLGNELVLIASGAAAPAVDLADLPDLLGEGRLAMAQLNAVPAGIYGKAALQHLGLWDQLSLKVAQTDNVRAALVLVSLGEAPFGIVYATDARADENVSVVARFPPDSHAPIVYPVAKVAGRNNPAADVFLAYLRHAQARAVFERLGFVVLGGQGE